MRAIILLIGDELLNGLKTDKNGQLLCQKCAELGIEINEIRILPDQIPAILNALQSCLNRTDFVFISGGLGPTVDDLTRDALREFFAPCEARYFAPAIAQIRKYKQAKQDFSELSEAELRQTIIFSSAHKIFNNPVGGAPAMSFLHQGIFWVSLPGVPSEFAVILEQEIIPYLRANYQLGQTLSQDLLLDGISEANLSDLLHNLYTQSPPQINWAYLPNFGLIHLRLSTRKPNLKTQLDQIYSQIKNLAKDFIIAAEKVDFFAYCRAFLCEHNLKIALAESCTGGALAASFTAEAGASEFFTYSAVVYSNMMKSRALGLNLRAEDNAVCEAVVRDMLKGVLDKSGADIGIAVSGYLNLPENSQFAREIWIAIGNKQQQQCFQEKLVFNDRLSNREYALQRIIYRLYCFLRALKLA